MNEAAPQPATPFPTPSPRPRPRRWEWTWRRRKAILLLCFGVVSGITCTDAILSAVKQEAVVVQLAQQLVAHEVRRGGPAQHAYLCGHACFFHTLPPSRLQPLFTASQSSSPTNIPR
jgi:hypothetical protein